MIDPFIAEKPQGGKQVLQSPAPLEPVLIPTNPEHRGFLCDSSGALKSAPFKGCSYVSALLSEEFLCHPVLVMVKPGIL